MAVESKEIINEKTYLQFQAGLNQMSTPNLQLPDADITMDYGGENRAIDTGGEEFPSGQQHGIIRTDGQMKGTAGFVGFNYPCELFFGHADPDELEAGVYERVYEPTTGHPNYATCDYGASDGFQRAADLFLQSLHLHATMNETLYDGAAIAQAMLDSRLDAISLADPGDVIIVPQRTPDPLRSTLWRAASLAGLATAPPFEIDHVFDFNIAGRRGPGYSMNAYLGGNFNRTIRKRPGTRDVMIQVGDDAVGRGYFTLIKTNGVEYLRWRVTGDVIGAGPGTAKVVSVDLSADDDPTGGTWPLTVFGITITGIPWNVTGPALQAIIRSLVAYGAKDVTVGKVGFVYAITFPEYLGNQPTVAASAVGLTGGVGDTFAVDVQTTTPGVEPVMEMIQVDCAVYSRDFPKRGSAPNYAEGEAVLDVALWLAKTADLNGIRITTRCAVEDLANPVLP